MGKRRKINELGKKVTWCIDNASVYLKWVSAISCIEIPLSLI